MCRLKTILKEGKQELIELNKIRETTQKNMRKSSRFSKQAILNIHQKKILEAKKFIENAKKIISRLKIIAKDYPEIIFTGTYSAALQEYCEANILLGLIKEKQFISPREIQVPYSEFILGLADVIGEFRRLSLDAIREDMVEKGEEYLKIMEKIYLELLALDEAYMLVKGLRRKCDVARKIIESTRGDITQEIRRKALEKSLTRIEKERIK